jgi:serine phosphatase RsbU (regulator of sigma subunit)
MIEWGVASRPRHGAASSGDGYLVQPTSRGLLVAVVDGIGHGPEAAAAAAVALALLKRHAEEPVATLVERCHAGLGHTRGVVLSLATFDANQSELTWLGVGNVEGILLRADPTAGRRVESLVRRAGVLGRRLPALSPVTLRVARGDTLIFATDGVLAEFSEELTPGPPRALAEGILERHAVRTDDALVLVASQRGDRAP